MSGTTGFSRRVVLGAALASPVVLRHALGEEQIRIGMPCALTGPGGEVGAQMRRGAEFWAKTVNASGGVIGRQIQLLVQDTGGDPAACVRKAQEAVERDRCQLLFGMTFSSEALGAVPKLAG